MSFSNSQAGQIGQYESAESISQATSCFDSVLLDVQTSMS